MGTSPFSHKPPPPLPQVPTQEQEIQVILVLSFLFPSLYAPTLYTSHFSKPNTEPGSYEDLWGVHGVKQV